MDEVPHMVLCSDLKRRRTVKLKRNTIFPLVHLDLTPLQSCLLRQQEMSCWATTLPLVPPPLPSSVVNVLPLLQILSYTHNPPWFSLTLCLFSSPCDSSGSNHLWFFSNWKSFSPPNHAFVTILALRICKGAIRLRKSLKHKLLNLLVRLPFSYALP